MRRTVLPRTSVAVAVALIGGLLLTGRADAQLPPGGSFSDDNGNEHEGNIEAIYAAGITNGCASGRFCPSQPVTRGEMAAFIARALGLGATSSDYFSDDNGSQFEDSINRLAAAGITTGCRSGAFCPGKLVSRQEMAAFLVRAYGYSGGAGKNTFSDDNGSFHEADIEALAAAGVTKGCGPGRYCPFGAVARDQMASFLARAEGLQPILPAPAPSVSGILVKPGDNLASMVAAHPPGTTFVLAAGIHRRQQVSPKKGNVFLGQPGAILSGEGVTEFAFGGTSTHVVIRGLVIENYANPPGTGAIRTSGGAYDWVVEKNEIRNNAGAGIYATQRWVVRGNNIHHNGQMGIFAVGENLVIENNEIAYNNTGNHNRTEAGGTKFMKTTNLVVRGNYSHHNNGPGLWTDGSNIYTLYENNVVTDNAGPGILHEVSYDAVIRNNTADRNGFGYTAWVDGAGILVNSSSNVEVHGNVVRNNNDGIAGIHAREGESGQYGAYNLKNLYVHHNTIVMSVGHTGIVTNRSSEVYGSSFNNRFDYNTYTLGTNANYFRWQGGEQNWQSWRAAGQDPNGSATR